MSLRAWKFFTVTSTCLVFCGLCEQSLPRTFIGAIFLVFLCVSVFIFIFMCVEAIGQPWVLFSDIIHLFVCCLFWGQVYHWPGVIHSREPASASSSWGYKRISPDFSREFWGSNSSPYVSVASGSQMVLAPQPSLSFNNFLRHFTYVSFHRGHAPVS